MNVKELYLMIHPLLGGKKMNPGKKSVNVLLFMLLFLCVACIPPSTGMVGEVEGPHQIEVQLNPNPAEMLKENEFLIKVMDESGNLVENAKVEVTLSMLDMDHGDLTFSCTSQGEGMYKGKGIPVMAGDWIATVNVEKDGQSSMMEYLFEASR